MNTVHTMADLMGAVAGCLRTGDVMGLDALAELVDGWLISEEERASMTDLIDAAIESAHERAAA